MSQRPAPIRYAVWAGNPKGFAENPKRCIEEVPCKPSGWYSVQCARPRGHGDHGLYCKQHATMRERRKANNA